MKVCIFRINGQYGHWRKWFTTTSPLTYSFPPRTSVVGLIGAIAGVKRERIASIFPCARTQIAICPTKPIVKDRMPENWRQSPVSFRNGKLDKCSAEKSVEGFQSNLEIVRDPSYRIVFGYQGKKEFAMEEFIQRLKQKHWTYQPYLGIMGFLADVEFESEDDAVNQEGKEVELHSVLPLSEATEHLVDISESEVYTREERMPVEVLLGRQFLYLNVAYIQSNGKPLLVKAKSKPVSYFRLKHLQQNVIFLESCAH